MQLHSPQDAPVLVYSPGTSEELVCRGVRLKYKVSSHFAFFEGYLSVEKGCLFCKKKQREKLEVKQDLGGRIENTSITFDDGIKLNGIVIALEDLK